MAILTFKIAVLPAAITGITDLNPKITGAFHGAMPSTTPSGFFMTSAYVFPCDEGIVPLMASVIVDAVSSTMPAAISTLSWDQSGVQ